MSTTTIAASQLIPLDDLIEMIKDVQRAGGVCAYVEVDLESTEPFKRAGVDVRDLLVSGPSSDERAAEIVGKMAATRAVDLIVWRTP
jgi:RecA/RadA recombinase